MNIERDGRQCCSRPMTALQDFEAPRKSWVRLESHLIVIHTNHKAVKQRVVLHSFPLAELGLT